MTWVLGSSPRMTGGKFVFFEKGFIKIKRINDLDPGVKPQDDEEEVGAKSPRITGEFLSLFFLKKGL